MSKIEKLSDKDVFLFPSIVNKWVKIGLKTGPADRERAERVIRNAYKVANLAEPKKIVWVDSPKEAVTLLKRKHKVEDVMSSIVYGQHEAEWLSFYDFFKRCESVNIENIDILNPMMEMAEECGWVWVYDDLVVVSERPTEIHMNNAGRLHHDTSQALRYADGWGLYSWHGYRIPRSHQWIFTDRHRLTPAAIEKEGNAELRRIMLEIYGFSNYLEEREAKVISTDKDGAGNERRLMEINVSGTPVRIIELINSSPEPDGTYRKFHLGAMRGDTPHDVVSASFGFNPKHFEEEVCS